jgi:hypothetical protein
MSEDQRTSLRRAIEILESARSRKAMYVSPVEPNVVIHWLSGVRIGLLASGIEWSPDDRQAVVEARGLRFLADWEAEQLAAQGRSPEEIVDELLLIEIEMWRRMAGSPA